METISDYTIYCTPEQTRKSLYLGAPIHTTNEHLYRHPHEYKYWAEVDIQGNLYAAKIPTAEQMCGWLKTQGFKFIFSDIEDFDGKYWVIIYNDKEISHGTDIENKELAAIDAALDYTSKLTTNKN